MHSMRAAQRGGGHFAQAKGANLAGGHQLGQRADAVLNRHLLVPAVQVIQVNHVGLQALERGFARGANGFGPAINDTHQFAFARCIHARHAAFAGQREAAAVSGQHIADQRFIGPEAVQRGRVKHSHTGVQRGQQHALALLCRHWRAVGMAEVHAAEADGRNAEGAELSIVHGI